MVRSTPREDLEKFSRLIQKPSTDSPPIASCEACRSTETCLPNKRRAILFFRPYSSRQPETSSKQWQLVKITGRSGEI